jgi:hypothetical protein
MFLKIKTIVNFYAGTLRTEVTKTGSPAVKQVPSHRHEVGCITLAQLGLQVVHAAWDRYLDAGGSAVEGGDAML